MAKGKITLQMLSEMMASNSGRSKSATEAFVRTFFTVLKDALQRDNLVKIKGFGTFKLVVVSARESVNVNTGERVNIAGYNKITFTPDKSLKDRINRPFAQFDTMVIDDEDISLIEGGESVETAIPDAEKATSVVEPMPAEMEQNKKVAADVLETEEVSEFVEEKAKGNAADEKADDAMAEIAEQNAVSFTEPATKPKRRVWQALAISLIMVLIAAGAFMLGKYFKDNSADTPRKVPLPVDTLLIPVDTAIALSADEKVAQDSVAQLRAAAAKYEQVEGGDYLIAGLKTSRKMQGGMTLERYCRRIYGSKEMVPYVLKYNKLESEKVPVGKVINFPVLVEKQ